MVYNPDITVSIHFDAGGRGKFAIPSAAITNLIQVISIGVKHLDPAISQIAHVEIVISIYGDNHSRPKLSVGRSS